MWKSGGTGPYVRAGRFFAPYGLRFAEHIYWVQRYTGYDLYNETYNLSGGFVEDEWELHVSAFTPPPESFPDALQSVGRRESGVAAYAREAVGRDGDGGAADAARVRQRGQPLPGGRRRQAVAGKGEGPAAGRGGRHPRQTSAPLRPARPSW